jgi:hypothetical protein
MLYLLLRLCIGNDRLDVVRKDIKDPAFGCWFHVEIGLLQTFKKNILPLSSGLKIVLMIEA